jgi:hypothetical protein
VQMGLKDQHLLEVFLHQNNLIIVPFLMKLFKACL